MSIDIRMEQASQLYIRKSNNAAMEMPIADFFHCEDIHDWAAESSQFCQMIKIAFLVWKDFSIPNMKKLELRIIYINYFQNCI